jgi:para-nitrobenzyl esterase
MIGTGAEEHGEDCLYLNVWTPAADGRRRPVMVWIHGGAFIMGSGSAGLYSGAHLARRGDVVVVTINYRLGALGFLNHPELAARDDGIAPNVGLRDQIAALAWVRDNIDAFGGDPENVTIFGESAGGMSVGTLLGTPAARGLFHRAIPQSGAAHNISRPHQAHTIAELFLSKLGLGPSDVEALRKISTQDILTAQRETTFEFGVALGGLAWQPSLDGDVLPEHPLDAIAAGCSRSVPVLIGSNRDEWKLFMLGDSKGRALDEDGLLRRLERILPGEDANGHPHSEVALEAYRRVTHGERSPSEMWIAFQSARIFHYPAIRLAELHSAHTPETYRYLFTWAPPLVRSRLGSCHGLEIPFVFGTLRQGLFRLIGLTAQSRTLSDRMQGAWMTFARTGHPGHEGLPEWPAFDPEERTLMVLDSHCFPKRMRYDEERDFWNTRLYSGNRRSEPAWELHA